MVLEENGEKCFGNAVLIINIFSDHESREESDMINKEEEMDTHTIRFSNYMTILIAAKLLQAVTDEAAISGDCEMKIS